MARKSRRRLGALAKLRERAAARPGSDQKSEVRSNRGVGGPQNGTSPSSTIGGGRGVGGPSTLPSGERPALFNASGLTLATVRGSDQAVAQIQRRSAERGRFDARVQANADQGRARLGPRGKPVGSGGKSRTPGPGEHGSTSALSSATTNAAGTSGNLLSTREQGALEFQRREQARMAGSQSSAGNTGRATPNTSLTTNTNVPSAVRAQAIQRGLANDPNAAARLGEASLKKAAQTDELLTKKKKKRLGGSPGSLGQASLKA